MNRFATASGATLLAATLGLDGAACGDTSADTSLTPQLSDRVAAGAAVTYSVTFTTAWTDVVTPGGLPDGAHFSPLIGAVHNAAGNRCRPARHRQVLGRADRDDELHPPGGRIAAAGVATVP